MPNTIETTVYSFDELSEQAKEKARDWFRQGQFDFDWWDSVYEDANNIAAILGIAIARCRPNNPKATGDLLIYFSGFSSQGDGASWEGYYSYAPDAGKKIREYAPQDEKLHLIADTLDMLQERHSCQLTATIKTSGRYSHEMTMSVDVSVDGDDTDENTTEAVTDTMRDFARWIYRTLEREYEYLQSDEQVDESICANEYQFDESGRIA